MVALKSFKKKLTPPIITSSSIIGIGATLACWQLWAGNSFTFNAIFLNLTIGLAIGSLYAMYATGLVVLYNTTGIFNFAQGAIGVFGAYLYWEVHINKGLHTLLALPLILIICGLIGILLDIVIMRKLKETSLVVQLMVTVAVMILLLALTGDIWESNTVRRVEFLFGNKGVRIFGVNILWHRIIVFLTAGTIAIGLRIFLRRTRLGIAMRSVVDSRELASLTGARPNFISSSAWALGSMLAGLGGILIAPELSLDPANLNIIVITAFAGAACGALRNLPMAFVGSIIIGVLIQFSRGFLDFGVDFRAAPEAIPPILLFLVVIAIPNTRLEIARIAKNLKSRERTTRPWEAMLGGGVLIFLAIAFSGGWFHFGFWDPGAWGSRPLNNAVFVMTLALIATSLVPLTGWAGQINFAPIAIAGFGAFIYFKFAGGSEFGQWYWLPLVALLTAPVGALIAIPVARLKGVYLALASMAFAQAMALLFFTNPSISPVTGIGIQYPPLNIFGIKLNDDRNEFIFLMIVFVIFVVGLVFLRHSRFGRRWIAMNDSQTASASVGVNVVWTKVVVYTISAGIAGIAGAFWAVAQGTVDGTRGYDIQLSWEIVLLFAAAGISIPMAGLFLSFRFLIGGLADRLADTENVDWLVTIFEKLEIYGPGLLALGMVVNSRGALYEIGRGFAHLLPWRKDAKEDFRLENERKRDPEIGELGISEEFIPSKVMELDRTLQIAREVIPEGGYKKLEDKGLHDPESDPSSNPPADPESDPSSNPSPDPETEKETEK